MAKSGRGGRRAMPSTPATDQPANGATPPPPSSEKAEPTASRPPTSHRNDRKSPATRPPAASARRDEPAPAREEPAYLIEGTGCTYGHQRGHELDAGRLGSVPTRKATRVGFFLVLWCAIGVGLVVDRRWLSIGIQLLVIWLAFSAVVQRRAGHRGRCWRTRSWRHAWGGLAPAMSDPTRPAGEDD